MKLAGFQGADGERPWKNMLNKGRLAGRCCAKKRPRENGHCGRGAFVILEVKEKKRE